MPTKQQLDILEKFETETMLRTLDLSGFGLDHGHMVNICAIVRNNPLLEHIILCHNNLGNSLLFLINNIFHLPHLKTLDVVDNNITDDNTYRALATLIKYKLTLESVYIGGKILTTLQGHPQLPSIIQQSPLVRYGAFFGFLRRDLGTMRLECTSTPGDYFTGFNEISRASFFDLFAAMREREIRKLPLKNFFLVSHERTLINKCRVLGSERIFQLGTSYDPTEYGKDTETTENLETILRLCIK